MKFVILVYRGRQSYAEVCTKDTKKKKKEIQEFHRFKKDNISKKKDKEKEITKQARKTIPLKEGQIQYIGTRPESS